MFTNDRVVAIIRAADERNARVEALLAQVVALLAGTAPAQGAPVVTPAASPVTAMADAATAESTAKARIACALHPDKAFAVTPAGSATGSGFHFGWCKGAPQAVAAKA